MKNLFTRQAEFRNKEDFFLYKEKTPEAVVEGLQEKEDGVLEAKKAKEVFGEELKKLLRESSTASSAEKNKTHSEEEAEKNEIEVEMEALEKGIVPETKKQVAVNEEEGLSDVGVRTLLDEVESDISAHFGTSSFKGFNPDQYV